MGRHSHGSWQQVGPLDVTGLDRTTRQGRIVGVSVRPTGRPDQLLGDWLPEGDAGLEYDGTAWLASRRGADGLPAPIGHLVPSVGDAPVVALPGTGGRLELIVGCLYAITYTGQDGVLWQWQDEQ